MSAANACAARWLSTACLPLGDFEVGLRRIVKLIETAPKDQVAEQAEQQLGLFLLGEQPGIFRVLVHEHLLQLVGNLQARWGEGAPGRSGREVAAGQPSVKRRTGHIGTLGLWSSGRLFEDFEVSSSPLAWNPWNDSSMHRAMLPFSRMIGGFPCCSLSNRSRLRKQGKDVG